MFMVKNLSQLKKALVLGARFDIVEHFNKPEWTGQKRVVKTVQTNGIYSAIAGEPDSPLSNSNYGKGIWLAFDKASNWTFDNGIATYVNNMGRACFSLDVKGV